MNRHTAPLLAVLCMAEMACATNAFEVVLTGQSTVQGGGVLGVGSMLTRIPAIGSFASIDFEASDEFQNRGVVKDAVQSLQVTAVLLQIQSPASQDFSFLDELSFYASDGSSEKLVASRHDIAQLNLPPPKPVLELEVEEPVELRPYLSAPTMNISVRGSGRQPMDDTVLEATVKLEVVLKLL